MKRGRSSARVTTTPRLEQNRYALSQGVALAKLRESTKCGHEPVESGVARDGGPHRLAGCSQRCVEPSTLIRPLSPSARRLRFVNCLVCMTQWLHSNTAKLMNGCSHRGSRYQYPLTMRRVLLSGSGSSKKPQSESVKNRGRPFAGSNRRPRRRSNDARSPRKRSGTNAATSHAFSISLVPEPTNMSPVLTFCHSG